MCMKENAESYMCLEGFTKMEKIQAFDIVYVRTEELECVQGMEQLPFTSQVCTINFNSTFYYLSEFQQQNMLSLYKLNRVSGNFKKPVSVISSGCWCSER